MAILSAFLLCGYLDSHLSYATVFEVINMYSLYAKLNHNLISLSALVTLLKVEFRQLQSVV